MAEFCKQCHLELFPEVDDSKYDFANLISEEDSNNGMVAVVLCEGCGMIEVNRKGECVSKDCKRHGEKHCEILLHDIIFWYDGYYPKELEESEVEHIENMISQGYIEGQLCTIHRVTKEEVYGWWKINKENK